MAVPAAAAAATAAKGNSWIAPAVQSATGIFGSLVAARANKKAWKRSVQHEQSVWERETAYNTPKAQMERMREAGLNPMLMYGQGSTGNASQGKAMQSESFMKDANPILAGLELFKDGALFGKELQQRDVNIDIGGETLTGLALRNQHEVDKWGITQAELQFVKRQFPLLLDKLKDEQNIRKSTMDDQKEAVSLRNAEVRSRLQTELLKRGLMEKDGTIKDEVLKSKAFSNELLKLQRDFMLDGDVSIGQFLKVLLSMFGSRI